MNLGHRSYSPSRLALWSALTMLVSQIVFADENKSEPPRALPPRPIISRSGQFFIYGRDSAAATQFSQYAERVKMLTLKRAGLDAAWRDPILLIFHDASENPAAKGTVQLAAKSLGPRQIYYMVHFYPPVEEQTLTEQLVEVVSIEAAVRGSDASVAPVSLPRPPLWWVHGVAQLAREDENESDGQLMAHAWSEGVPTTAAKLLAAKTLPADAWDRRYFQAQCGGLVQALTDLSESADAMAQFLKQIARGASPVESFHRAWQARFPDEISLEKWWAVECVAQTQLMQARLFSTAATASTLEKLLNFRLAASPQDKPVEWPLDVLALHAQEPEIQRLLQERAARLRLLTTQAHPFYESAVSLYAEALEKLAQGNTNAFKITLRKAQQAREQAQSRVALTENFVRETESALTGASRADSYLNELNEFKALNQQRTTLIKSFLDEVEKERDR